MAEAQNSGEPFQFDYVKCLRDVLNLNHMTVIYSNIDGTTLCGRFQCTAELSTDPPTICVGSAYSKFQAKQEAAHTALEYLLQKDKIQKNNAN